MKKTIERSVAIDTLDTLIKTASIDSYDRRLQTKAGDVTLTVPKLRNLPFETAIIERYRRREFLVEEALILASRTIS